MNADTTYLVVAFVAGVWVGFLFAKVLFKFDRARRGWKRRI